MNPVTGAPCRFSRGECALERSKVGSRLGSGVVRRTGLLTIERFSIRVRFDPDRRRQRAAVTAANRRHR